MHSSGISEVTAIKESLIIPAVVTKSDCETTSILMVGDIFLIPRHGNDMTVPGGHVWPLQYFSKCTLLLKRLPEVFESSAP